MSTPVYDGMPIADRTFEVKPWGIIRCGGVCKDDYDRIAHYDQTASRIVTLQKAALESFKAAEDAIGHPARPHILLTGSWRSCAQQSALYRSDSSRFAPPNETAHCRALAIDVDQAQGPGRLDRIHQALVSRDWYQARADEAWHYSFGIKV